MSLNQVDGKLGIHFLNNKTPRKKKKKRKIRFQRHLYA